MPASSLQRCGILWLALHFAVVYLLVNLCTPWLAGWTQGRLLPWLRCPTEMSSFQFLFSHLLLFSILPAFTAALLNLKIRDKTAQLAWTLPAAILAYRLVTFPSSVLHQHPSALYYFFASNFAIPEFKNWVDLQNLLSNPDMKRGMAQLKYTAPFYAGVAYSLGAKLAIVARTWIGRAGRAGPP
jgi:hypothetical protein